MSARNALVVASAHDIASANATDHDFVTMRLQGQLFGISVMAVQDVLRRLTVSPVPLAPPVVAGSLNIRGRIVTALDMRMRLHMPDSESSETTMYVVVEYQGELYALMVDAVGDVLNLPLAQFEKPPANLDHNWLGIASGVFKLQDELLIILDVAAIISGVVS
jgi:purine-binding chemotaxis protein CheW